MDFTEPKLISSNAFKGSNGKRASSRNRRTASAPDPAGRKLSSTAPNSGPSSRDTSPSCSGDEDEDITVASGSTSGGGNNGGSMMGLLFPQSTSLSSTSAAGSGGGVNVSGVHCSSLATSPQSDFYVPGSSGPGPNVAFSSPGDGTNGSESSQKRSPICSPKGNKTHSPSSVLLKQQQRQREYKFGKEKKEGNKSSLKKASSVDTHGMTDERKLLKKLGSKAYIARPGKGTQQKPTQVGVGVGQGNIRRRQVDWKGGAQGSSMKSGGSNRINSSSSGSKPLKSILKNPLFKAKSKSHQGGGGGGSKQVTERTSWAPTLLKSEIPAVSRVPVRWFLKRNFSHMMQKHLNEDPDLSPPPVLESGQQPSSSSSSVPSKKFKTGDEPSSSSSTDKESEAKSSEREQAELLHYVKGVQSLEELLETDVATRLPNLLHAVIEKLSTALCSAGKENWVGYVRKLLVEKRRSEAGKLLLLEDDDEEEEEEEESSPLACSSSSSYRPVFPMATVLEESPSLQYPRVSEEDMNAYETLVGSKHELEVPSDHNDFCQLFVNIMEAELKLLAQRKQEQEKGRSGMLTSDEGGGLKTVHAKIIPVNKFEEGQNLHGLFIPMESFSELLTVSGS
jgi:hypothetical protein